MCLGEQLYRAASLDEVRTLSTLLGKHPNLREAPVFEGLTPLMAACAHGGRSAVKMLVDMGVAIDEPSMADGMTPLMYACARGHVEVVDMLLAHGADATRGNALGSNGGMKMTPLVYAAGAGHVTVVKRLLKHPGVALNEENANGVECCLPLVLACRNGHAAVAKSLLEAGGEYVVALAVMQQMMGRGADSPCLRLLETVHADNERFALLEKARRVHDDTTSVAHFPSATPVPRYLARRVGNGEALPALRLTSPATVTPPPDACPAVSPPSATSRDTASGGRKKRRKRGQAAGPTPVPPESLQQPLQGRRRPLPA